MATISSEFVIYNEHIQLELLKGNVELLKKEIKRKGEKSNIIKIYIDGIKEEKSTIIKIYIDGIKQDTFTGSEIQKYTSVHNQGNSNRCYLEKFRYFEQDFVHLYNIYNTFGYDTLTNTIDHYQYFSILKSIEDTSHLIINKAQNKAHDAIKDFVRTHHIPIDRPKPRIQIATPRQEGCIKYFIFRYMVLYRILNKKIINTLHRLHNNIQVALHYKHQSHLKKQNVFYNENQSHHNRRRIRGKIHATHQKELLGVYEELGKISEKKLREVYEQVGDVTVRYVILDNSHKVVGIAHIDPDTRPLTTMDYTISQDDINDALQYLRRNLVTNQPGFLSELPEHFINKLRNIIAKLMACLETNYAISTSALEVLQLLKTIDAENRNRRKIAFDKLSADLDTGSVVSVRAILHEIACLKTNYAISASALEVTQFCKTLDAVNQTDVVNQTRRNIPGQIVWAKPRADLVEQLFKTFDVVNQTRRKIRGEIVWANLRTGLGIKSKVSASEMLRRIALAKPSDYLRNIARGNLVLRIRRTFQFAKLHTDLDELKNRSVVSASAGVRNRRAIARNSANVRNRHAIALKLSHLHAAIDAKGVKQLDESIENEKHKRRGIACHINTTMLLSDILETHSQVVTSPKTLINCRGFVCKCGDRTQVEDNPCASNVNGWYLVRVGTGEDLLKRYT